MKLKKILLFTIIAIVSIQVSAQGFPAEKRIYLFDITASMTGYGEGNVDIFNKVKNQLIKAVSEVDNNTEIVVVPYTTKTYPIITGTKQEILSKLNKINTLKEDTNIDAAWTKGFSLLDSAKVNYLFLLTDGRHNYGVEKKEFYKNLSSWKEKSSGRYFFAFYIMLTENADDQEIRSIARNTPQMWSLMSMDVNVTFVLTPFSLKTNTYGKKEMAIRFKCNHIDELKNLSGLKIIEEANPYYEFTRSYIDYKTQTLRISFKEKMEHVKIPVEYKLGAHIYYDQQKTPLLFFTPDDIYIKMGNRGKKTMIFKQDINKSSTQKTIK